MTDFKAAATFVAAASYIMPSIRSRGVGDGLRMIFRHADIKYEAVRPAMGRTAPAIQPHFFSTTQAAATRARIWASAKRRPSSMSA